MAYTQSIKIPTNNTISTYAILNAADTLSMQRKTGETFTTFNKLHNLIKYLYIIFKNRVTTFTKQMLFIKVQPRANNFSGIVLRRRVTMLNKPIYKKKRKKVRSKYVNNTKYQLQMTTFTRFTCVRAFRKIFRISKPGFAGFLIPVRLFFSNTQQLTLSAQARGFFHHGRGNTVTMFNLNAINRIAGFGAASGISIEKLKKRKIRGPFIKNVSAMLRHVRRAEKFKPWFPKPLWKKVLKRFKYNRPRLFAYFKHKQLYSNWKLAFASFKRRQYFKYFKKFMGFTSKYNPIKNLVKTTKSQALMVKLIQTDALYTRLHNIFVKLLYRFGRMKPDTFAKKVSLRIRSNINIIQLKRRYQLHFRQQERHRARLQYVPKVSVVTWYTAGKLGFHSNKRTTAFAAESIGRHIALYLKKRNIHFINLEYTLPIIKKIRAFYKGLSRTQMQVLRIYYKRKVMFGSIRKPKQRRV